MRPPPGLPDTYLRCSCGVCWSWVSQLAGLPYIVPPSATPSRRHIVTLSRRLLAVRAPPRGPLAMLCCPGSCMAPQEAVPQGAGATLVVAQGLAAGQVSAAYRGYRMHVDTHLAACAGPARPSHCRSLTAGSCRAMPLRLPAAAWRCCGRRLQLSLSGHLSQCCLRAAALEAGTQNGLSTDSSEDPDCGGRKQAN